MRTGARQQSDLRSPRPHQARARGRVFASRLVAHTKRGARYRSGRPRSAVRTGARSRRSIAVRRERLDRALEYTPYQIDVPPETTVLWMNRDGVDHDVTLRDGDLKGPLVGKGGEIAVMFKKPGEYAYFCRVHPFMHGKVVVE